VQVACLVDRWDDYVDCLLPTWFLEHLFGSYFKRFLAMNDYLIRENGPLIPQNWCR
jgi:hypothetical protein